MTTARLDWCELSYTEDTGQGEKEAELHAGQAVKRTKI